MIYFTSNWHLYHTNYNANRIITNDGIIDDRQFAVELTVIERYQAIVKEEDEIYFLGDFTFGNYERAQAVLSKIRGKKHFIQGAFDTRKSTKLFKEHGVYLGDNHKIKYEGFKFVLSHFPYSKWHKGHINVFGQRDKLKPREHQISVAVDFWEYFPVSVEDIINFNNSSP